MEPIVESDRYGVAMLVGWRRKDGSRKRGEFRLKKPQVWIDRQKIAEGKALTPGAQIIMDERKRRVSWEGESPDECFHNYPNGEFAAAARCYMMEPDRRSSLPPIVDRHGVPVGDQLPDAWPFSAAEWRPGERIRELQVAGALFLAEAERLKLAGKPDEATQVEGLAMACAKSIDDIYQVGPVSPGPWMMEPTAGGEN